MSSFTDRFEIIGLTGFPEVKEGDRLAPLIVDRAKAMASGVLENDIIVVASKVVSIEERRRVSLDTIQPSDDARLLADRVRKDPRLVELILRESKSYRVAGKHGPIVAYHRLGLELTSAGVDRAGPDAAYILPENPDASAQRLMSEIAALTGTKRIGLIIADSDGRPDRKGSTVLSIGSFGISPLRQTVVGDEQKVQEETIVDLISAAAGIVLGQRGRGVPSVIVRGVNWSSSEQGVKAILHS